METVVFVVNKIPLYFHLFLLFSIWLWCLIPTYYFILYLYYSSLGLLKLVIIELVIHFLSLLSIRTMGNCKSHAKTS